MRIENIIELIRNEIENEKTRSAWARGVNDYASDILDKMEENEIIPESKENLIDAMLNGAHEYRKARPNLYDHWKVASWGGSYLVYNYDIAKRLCTPSELKRTKEGDRRPNKDEEWLDVQARALYQAGNKIIAAYVKIVNAIEKEAENESAKETA